jgi:Na+/melibiose symporter-like transporter
MAVSCLLLVGLTTTTSFTWLFVAYIIFGIGFGFVNAPITNAAVSGMPRAQAGVAAAIASTSRQVGSTLGVAVVGALVSASVAKGGHLNFATASRAGWWTLFGCAMVVLLLGLVATTSWAKSTAERTAEALNPEFLEGHTP